MKDSMWDKLSLKDKAEIIRVGISNGITTIPKIKEAYNKFAGGGEFNSDEVLDRATRVYTNYDEAKDFDMNPLYYGVRNFMYQNGIPHSGLSNCTLSATQWIDPNNPIKSAKTIVTNPTANGYTQIKQEDILPGNLMISRNPENGSYHTMLVESINADGTPNLRYSTGGPDNSSMRYGISQKEYHDRDSKQGGNHTQDMFFRYNYPNEKWLPEIIVRPNKKEEGGNLFWEGGYEPSDYIKKRISFYEGDAMSKSTKDPYSGKIVKKNNSFENEAISFVSAMPPEIRKSVLSNPELSDYLYSYSYNVGAGNFKKRVVPALERYYNGKGSAKDIANSMWASGDSKLKGLQKRRAEERQGVIDALNRDNRNTSVTQNTVISDIPLMNVDPSTLYKAPVIDETLLVLPKTDTNEIYNPQEEGINNLQRFNTMMSIMDIENPLGNITDVKSNPLLIFNI